MQQQTAINAYYAFKDSHKHLKQKELVLAAFKELGVASDADVQRLTGIGIRQAATRRGELGTLIIKCGTKLDDITQVEVSTYKINPAPDLFPVKKVSNADKLDMIKELCLSEKVYTFVQVQDVLRIIAL